MTLASGFRVRSWRGRELSDLLAGRFHVGLERNLDELVLQTCLRCDRISWGDSISEGTDFSPPTEDLGGDAAVSHLFAVTAGLRSPVYGESAVQGQVRKTLLRYEERGGRGRPLHHLLQAALAFGKAVRSETTLGSVAETWGGRVLRLAAAWCLPEGSVGVVFGSGELAAEVSSRLASEGFVVRRFGKHLVDGESPDRLEARMAEARFVVSAGSPRSPVWTMERERTTVGERAFLDLSNPPGLDPALRADRRFADLADLREGAFGVPAEERRKIDDMLREAVHSFQSRRAAAERSTS